MSEAPQQIVAAEEPQEVAVAEVEVSGMEVGKKSQGFVRQLQFSESLENARQNP